jgi:hypothetical protein
MVIPKNQKNHQKNQNNIYEIEMLVLGIAQMTTD